MDALNIAKLIQNQFPDAVREIVVFRGQAAIVVYKSAILNILRFLKDEPSLAFSHLSDLCGVDFGEAQEPRFALVYNLYSLEHKHRIRLRAQVPSDDCSIESASELWDGAGWHECECYDMFGITFHNHPDLRRVLMPEDWKGHPLRKDYPAEGPAEKWAGYTEVLAKAEAYRKYDLRKR